MRKTNTIITIGREFGSGGHEIGAHLAEKLEIPLYDKEMLDRASKDSGIAEEILKAHDEKPTSSFLYSLVMDTYSLGYKTGSYSDMPINHKIFLAQFEAIKKIADEGPCILIGRCADYALENYSNVLSVFIHADTTKRAKRISRMYDMTESKAREMILRTDKKRGSYYNYYTNKKWSAVQSYDVCLDSGKLGIDGCVETIIEIIKVKERMKKAVL